MTSAATTAIQFSSFSHPKFQIISNHPIANFPQTTYEYLGKSTSMGTCTETSSVSGESEPSCHAVPYQPCHAIPYHTHGPWRVLELQPQQPCRSIPGQRVRQGGVPLLPYRSRKPPSSPVCVGLCWSRSEEMRNGEWWMIRPEAVVRCSKNKNII